MILAIETAAETGGIALLEGERVLGERTTGALRSPPGATRIDRPHAAALMVELDALLTAVGRPLVEVETIALSIGPGSFTGLRIGLATALGLCFGTSRRIVPVSTLAALSLQAEPADRIVPMLDARKGEVYTGLYGPGGRVLEEDRVCDPLRWLHGLPTTGPLHLLGPGARLYRNEVETALGERGVLLDAAQGTPRASSVGRLGARRLAEGEARDPREVRLRYLRASDAERGAAARGRTRGGLADAGQPPGKPII